MVITQAYFQRAQNAFYKKVIESPRSATIRIFTADVVSDSIEDFTGSSERTYIDYSFPVLDSYVTEPHERELFGLGMTQVGNIYLSPLQLMPVLGYYTLRDISEKIVVILEDHSYLVNYIDYMGKVYDSCVGVKISLKEHIRG